MVTFRIDDIGASTKYYNQHGKSIFKFHDIPFFYFPLANFWFFKRIWPFKKWAKYNELTAGEWEIFLEIFKKNNIKPIIAITACWVEKDSSLTPFPEKFPEEANILKKAHINNDIIIANHGLTHCIVGEHLPRLFSANRNLHREFYPYLDQEVHTNHIMGSQKILESFFKKPISIFVPPGHIWSLKTYRALKGTNVKKIISLKYMQDSDQQMDGIEFFNENSDFFSFHDRELKLFGDKWLKQKIEEYKQIN